MTNEVDIKISSTDKTKPAFKSIEKSLKGLGDQSKAAGDDVEKLGKDTKQTGDKFDKLGQDASGSGKKIGDLSGKSKEAKQDIKKMSESADDAAGSFSDMAAKAGVAAGAIGTVGSALSAGFQMDQAEGALAAKLGLSDEEAERVGAIQGELYANAYGESMGELSDITSSAVRALGGDMASISDGELKRLTTDLVNLGSTFGVGFEESADAIRGIISNDLAASADEAADILTKGLQIDPSGDILDTFREYGSELKQLGISGEEFLSMASAGLGAGARNTDYLADALKEAGIRLTEMGKDASNEVSALGLNVQQIQADVAAGGDRGAAAMKEVFKALGKVDDEVGRNAAGVAIFGTKWEDLSSEIVMSMGNAEGAIAGLGDAAEDMDKNINDNIGVSLETLKRQIITGLGSALAPVVAKITEAVQKIDFEKVKTKVKGFVNAITPILSLIGKVILKVIVPAISKFAGWMSELAKHKTLMQSIGVAIMAMLIPAFVAWAASAGAAAVATIAATWPLLAIGAVIAGLAYLVIKNWDSIKQATMVVWGAVSAVIGVHIAVIKTVVKAAIAVIKAVWNSIKAPVKAVWAFIKAVVGLHMAVIKALITVAVGVILAIWDSIKAPIKAVWNFIKSIVSGAMNVVKGAVRKAVNPILNKWREIKSTVTNVFNGVKSFISNIMQKVYDNTIGKLQPIIDKINTLKNMISSISVDGVKNAVKKIPGLATGGIGNGLTMVGERGPELVNLPAGSRVKSNPTSRAELGGAHYGVGEGSPIIINVHGSILSEQELLRVVKDSLQGGGMHGLIGV